MEKTNASSVKTQQIVVFISVLLFILKMIAWYVTSSVAILTDALESTVNVIAGFIGLYSLVISSRPKDEDHPYGHGKVEFISAAFEGILISLAGLIIIYEAANNFIHPHKIQQLDIGLILVATTGIINYLLGYFCVRKGMLENSPVLIAGGNHLKTDTYSTIGILIGIGLILLTGKPWIDSVAAIIFAFIIIFTGYKIIRKSISGMMDEADLEIIDEVKEVLISNRMNTWIDVHNLRIINYAGFYHIDCHLTVPYYLTIHEGHEILDSFTHILTEHFQHRVEFFVHIDGCQFFQCTLCKIENCAARKQNFEEEVTWTTENLISNQKHKLILNEQ